MGLAIAHRVGIPLSAKAITLSLPIALNAAIANATPTLIDISFNKKLSDTLPDTSAFTVAGKTIISVSIDTTGFIITAEVSEAFAMGDRPIIYYTKPEDNPLQSITGSLQVDSFLKAITNYIGTGTLIDEHLTYGYLYNWYAATDVRGIAPTGWHLPTKDEFLTLLKHIDPTVGEPDEYSDSAGGALKETGTTHWETPNIGATNSTGFTGLGAGIRDDAGNFSNLLNIAVFVSSMTGGTVVYNALVLSSEIAGTYLTSILNCVGTSIRLIKDDSNDPGTMTDYDENVYNTVKIGNQVWMKENLKVTHYKDGTAIPEVTDTDEWLILSSGARCSYTHIQEAVTADSTTITADNTTITVDKQ